jgi:hypothetical protein
LFRDRLGRGSGEVKVMKAEVRKSKGVVMPSREELQEIQVGRKKKS